MIFLTLPWPPTLNSMYPSGKNGRRFLSDAGKEFKEKAIWACRQQLGATQPIVGRLAVILRMFPPSKRKRDIANYEKACCDAMTSAGVWADDEQIDHLEIIRREIDPDGNGYVEVEIVERATESGS